MGYINLLVGSDANISIKNKQLWLKNIKTGAEMDYPLEDINSIIIESLLSNITTKTLCELTKNNVATYFCDESHLPSSYLLKYNGFYKNLSVYNMQVACPKPLQKRIWQSIIQSKINNQSAVLSLCGIENDLLKFSNDVTSGDTTNIESVVALKYFKMMFGDSFSRRKDNLINSALNYGYSIIRGVIARSVVAHGLLPFIGIHHCNQLNAFNLVDDFIEPFRAVVDLFVYNNFIDSNETELNSSMKQSLVGLLNANILINDKIYSLSYAVDIYIASYIECLTTKENKLLLPVVMEYENHKYE